MNTIKVYLATSGRIADLKKDFPLYQGQFQNKLLNVFVPTSILAPNFSVQESGNTIADYVSSTAIKIGMRTIERNGKIHTSKTYYMRYLKTLTYQNIEYALYERKLPREFTFYAGQGENAPVLIANVVNVNNETTPATIIDITPSQTCSLDVMPSGYLDTDEPIEATALEEINSRLNAIDEDLPKKQYIQDDTLETKAKTIVGAINENKGRIDINTQNIETNTQNIATNRNDIDFLMQNMQMSEEYIGQLKGTTLPSNSQLTQFVRDNTTPSREPKSGDIVIFILEVDGGTDKNYKYFYTATQWQGYEIPPLETASNGTLGIVQGTYGVADYNTLVDISGGQILNVYVKDKTGAYRNIAEYSNTTMAEINDILDGTSIVGEAMKALEDGLGNNIVNTYLTKTLGASKQYVRDYAMPREFNDVDFISSAGYQDNVPTSASGIQFTTNTNAVGDFQLFQVQKMNSADFELSSKNGYSNNIYVSASADCVVTFRLTTQYKKAGQDWADLNVELTSPITLTAGNIEKIVFGNPFTSLGKNVISLTDGDLIRQTLEVITQTSSALTFNVYSNEIYPSTFNLTSQSYVLSGIEQSVSRLILLGADGVIEANRVVFEVQNPDSFVEYRTNQREFLINCHLPIVGELDDTLPVYITFGENTYGVFSYMKGSSTPITIGDLKSNMTYNQATGYSFTSKMIFLETSDYVGFVISPATITAEQLINIIEDTETIVLSLDNNKTKLNIQLSNDVITKLARTLTTPLSTPSSTELVGVDSNNLQQMIELGRGLSIVDGVLTVKLDDTLTYVSYAVSQSLTDEQKALARANIGAGTSDFSGSYPDLTQKPILNTSNTTSQTAQADETIDGTINLHKVSKTGALADAIQDSTHRTVTDTEKQTWNNKSDFNGSFNSLTDVPQASTGVAGIIQVATDNEAETGTNTTKAVNPKQLKTAIAGLGSVFTLKGSVATVEDLPSTGNEIGDVYYVVSESVGYIWLNDGGIKNRWEQLGLPIDLSGYVQFTDIINALNSTASDKPLSALQGKVLNDKISTLTQDVANLQNEIGDIQTALDEINGEVI